MEEIDALLTKEERLNRLAEINVLVQVKNLYQTSIMRKALHEEKAPVVHGWVLNIRTGLIKDLQVSTKQWELRPQALVVESILPLPDFKFMDEDLGCFSQEAY
ncbi:hypothetical protein DP116_17315 [Brasilonema bromeliae SPC951]|uniref:Carbonic anhydrase n=1 Tax=Brasilonema bromeliae SPC951 TaxID=385972 RepID=A0ABX1P9V0_9CYAN|nr:hypothetical protein [Brasilonema bromeliae SPC951]